MTLFIQLTVSWYHEMVAATFIVAVSAVGAAALDCLTLLCRPSVEWWATAEPPRLVRPLTALAVAFHITAIGLSAVGSDSPELEVYQSLAAAYWFLMIGYVEGMVAKRYNFVRVVLVLAACVQIVGVVYLSSAAFEEEERIELTVALPFAFAACVWSVVYDAIIYRLPGDTYSAI